MKIRIKFAKEGNMKYVGHLDTMRYFQKALRRADIPVAYSEGYSPHMIMSFAIPLGVGMTSHGEYFDLQLAGEISSQELTDRLNRQMAEGFHVVSSVKVEEGKKGNAMSLVAACDYSIRIADETVYGSDWQTSFKRFLAQDSLPITRRTKRSEKTIDLKPLIYDAGVDKDTIFVRLASSSSDYIKPQQVMDCFAAWMDRKPSPGSYTVCREEMYADVGGDDAHRFVTLESLGTPIL